MTTQVLGVSERSLRLAKQYISEGDVVAFHTETVYGLGADARSDAAVKHIFELKGRPQNNPLIVHVHREFDITSLVDFIPPYAELLAKAYLPGPLTMVYPSSNKVSGLVSCGLNTLAVRVPSSETAQAFLRAVDIPIAAPSANLSKHISPVTAQHVFEDFSGRIPLILDGGKCEGGIESTVLDCTGETPLILRAGLVTQEMIASVAGSCGVYIPKEGEQPRSPGMAYKHYAPKCRTAFFSPEELERLKSVAQNLISSGAVGGGKGQNEDSSKPSAASEKTGGGISSLFGEDLTKTLATVAGQMGKEDDRTRFIHALMPLLSEERRQKAEEAMRFLRLMDVLPLLKGLF